MIIFKTLSPKNLIQLHEWLQLSHVREFWQVSAHYFQSDEVQRYLFFIEENPAGYIQSYFCTQTEKKWVSIFLLVINCF